MRGKKVLVVGGTGFIGFHLVKKCLSLQMIVTSISSKKPSKFQKLNKAIYKICNLNNLQKLKKIIKSDFDFVVNLGGNIDHNNKIKTYKSHYLGAKNLYELARLKKIKKFIQIGSSSEYGKFFGAVKETDICKPKMIYGKSKLNATEFLLHKHKKENFPVTILRFFQVYGPYQKTNRLIPNIICSSLKNQSFLCSEGSQLRDFLYVDDAINSIIKNLNNKKKAIGKILNIGFGKPIKVKELILMIKKMINKGKPIFGKIKLRIDESKKIYPDLKRAKKILKWKSKITLEEGLLKTVNFYKKNIN
jgi:nucleoside-diphosphate-sugar epimerase